MLYSIQNNTNSSVSVEYIHVQVVAKSLRSPLNFEDFHFYLIYGSNQKQKSF